MKVSPEILRFFTPSGPVVSNLVRVDALASLSSGPRRPYRSSEAGEHHGPPPEQAVESFHVFMPPRPKTINCTGIYNRVSRG
jgi:hypothetical protein